MYIFDPISGPGSSGPVLSFRGTRTESPDRWESLLSLQNPELKFMTYETGSNVSNARIKDFKIEKKNVEYTATLQESDIGNFNTLINLN